MFVTISMDAGDLLLDLCDSPTKSSISKQIASEQGFEIIDLPLSKTEVNDLIGFPILNEKTDN